MIEDVTTIEGKSMLLELHPGQATPLKDASYISKNEACQHWVWRIQEYHWIYF